MFNSLMCKIAWHRPASAAHGAAAIEGYKFMCYLVANLPSIAPYGTAHKRRIAGSFRRPQARASSWGLMAKATLSACMAVLKAPAALSQAAAKVLMLAILLLCFNRKIDSAEVACQQLCMMQACHVSSVHTCTLSPGLWRTGALRR